MTIDPLGIDTYVGDRHGDVQQLMDAGPPWHWHTHKLTQGTWHDEVERVNQFRQTILDHPRYAVDFWDGYYHYYDFSQDPVAQADFFWSCMDKIGGEQAGTMWAMVDVERGGQRRIPSSQQVQDGVGAWAARYEQLSGWKASLYGGELLRALGLGGPGKPVDLMGCGRSVVAAYLAELHGEHETTEQFLARTGTDLAHLLGWQYCGDGAAALKDYPRQAPGFGPIDITVLTLPGGLPAMVGALNA